MAERAGRAWSTGSARDVGSGARAEPLFLLDTRDLFGQLFNAEVRQEGRALLRVVSRAGIVLSQETDRVDPAECVSESAKASLAKLTVIGNQLFHRTPPSPGVLDQNTELSGHSRSFSGGSREGSRPSRIWTRTRARLKPHGGCRTWRSPEIPETRFGVEALEPSQVPGDRGRPSRRQPLAVA